MGLTEIHAPLPSTSLHLEWKSHFQACAVETGRFPQTSLPLETMCSAWQSYIIKKSCSAHIRLDVSKK